MIWLLSGCLLLAERPDGDGYDLFGNGGGGTDDVLVGEGDVVAVGVGYTDACAVYENGGLRCSGYGDGPKGEFVDIDGGLGGYCGIEVDDTLVCPDDDDAPGSAVQVDVGSSTSCAVTPSGELRCWGSNYEGVADPPSGNDWVKVDLGRSNACALDESGRVECWGDEFYDIHLVPDATFIDIAVSGDQACGVTEDTHVVCWGWYLSDIVPPTSGRYSTIVAGDDHYCAIKTDDGVRCWGDDDYQQASPPSGGFTRLNAESDGTCGITAGMVKCWGDVDDEGL